MSRFFRSAHSSNTDTESSDSQAEAEVSAQHVASQGLPSPSQALGPNIAVNGKDWVIHSLLEERCLNQVYAERSHKEYDDQEVREEASRRYRALITRLAPLNVVSAGLEDDKHTVNRQWVRDMLDGVELNDSQARQVARIATPASLQRLLTKGDAPTTPSSPLKTMLIDRLTMVDQPSIMTRYSVDFVELGPLGKGGYGEVFRVRHHLDQREYAVKKVPIRPKLISRILTEGDGVMHEVLAEVQTLSRLDHPNVVRYFSSWIEWPGMERRNSDLSSYQPFKALGDAETSPQIDDSLHRVHTESDRLTDDPFESHSQSSNILPEPAAKTDSGESSSHSGIGTELEKTWGPTPTLHMQMDVYPMTLADFIAPKARSSGVLPLSHCFHLETTTRILLAILDGVEYVHSKGMVHMDLKPANIFLKHEDNPRAAHTVDLLLCSECRQAGKAQPAKLSVRIGDFGLVKNLAEQPAIEFASSKAGTSLYRPRTTRIGPQRDMYAAGVIACELLCPFSTEFERRETLDKLHDRCLPNHFPTCEETLSNKVKSCIAAMLADPEEQISIEKTKHRLSSLIAPQSFSVFSAQRANDEFSRRSST